MFGAFLPFSQRGGVFVRSFVQNYIELGEFYPEQTNAPTSPSAAQPRCATQIAL